MAGSVVQQSKQLQDVLQSRNVPLKLILDMEKGPAGEGMSGILIDVAATSRPLRGGVPACCVETLWRSGMLGTLHGMHASCMHAPHAARQSIAGVMMCFLPRTCQDHSDSYPHARRRLPCNV